MSSSDLKQLESLLLSFYVHEGKNLTQSERGSVIKITNYLENKRIEERNKKCLDVQPEITEKIVLSLTR